MCFVVLLFGLLEDGVDDGELICSVINMRIVIKFYEKNDQYFCYLLFGLGKGGYWIISLIILYFYFIEV